MRLIDADEYAYFMKTYANGIRNAKPNVAELLDVIVDSICEWPTAYDIDKIVEELTHESSRWKESGEAYDDDQEKGISIGLKKVAAIIVKAGEKNGIEKTYRSDNGIVGNQRYKGITKYDTKYL